MVQIIQKYSPSPAPEFLFEFPFESSFSYKAAKKWMDANWTSSIYWSLMYIVFIFTGRHLMKNRKPFELRRPMFFWSLGLAIFSILGTLRFLPETIHALRNFGFHYSVCDNSYYDNNKVTGFWAFMFVISKLPELGDTLFIVLRKQNFMFLHYYHHISVLIMTWYSYHTKYSLGRWYGSMNYSVHAVMYTYYASRALGIRIPKQLAMLITFSQIAQMIVGLYVTFYSYLHLDNCNSSNKPHNVLLSLLVYFSYFVLFVDFFIRTYFGKKRLSESRNEKIERSKVSLDVNGNTIMEKLKKID